VPDIVRDVGMSSSTAGVMLALFMLFGLPTAMALPVLAARVSDQRPLVLGTGALWAAGIVGLLLSPGTATPVWMILLGLAQGAGIALALTLIVLRAPDGASAAALSGMVQSIGYLVEHRLPGGPGRARGARAAARRQPRLARPRPAMLAAAGGFLIAGVTAVTGMRRTRLATV
jgi:CP family cyanate transporter-like MFS transporter